MNTFLGFGKQYVEKHYQKTGQRVYLHLKRTRKLVKYKKKKKKSNLFWNWELGCVSVFSQIRCSLSSNVTDVFLGELRYTSSSAPLMVNCCTDCPRYFCLASFCFQSSLISILKACYSLPAPPNSISPFLLNETEGRRHQLQCWGPPKEETNSLGYW